VVELKYMRKKRMNKNTVNEYSTTGYIPGMLAIIQDINVCFSVSYIKHKSEMHKTAISHAFFVLY
jgi:hypothetical protein